MSKYQIIPSIWGSLEAECWSRDFKYSDYWKHGGRLTKEQYEELTSLFQKWMEEEIGEAQTLMGVK